MKQPIGGVAVYVLPRHTIKSIDESSSGMQDVIAALQHSLEHVCPTLGTRWTNWPLISQFTNARGYFQISGEITRGKESIFRDVYENFAALSALRAISGINCAQKLELGLDDTTPGADSS